MSTDDKVARFEAMKAKFPASEMPRWSLANALADAGRRDEAIAELQSLVAMKADYCVAWLKLGELTLAAGDHPTARAALQETVRLAVAQGHSAPRNEAESLLEELDD